MSLCVIFVQISLYLCNPLLEGSLIVRRGETVYPIILGARTFFLCLLYSLFKTSNSEKCPLVPPCILAPLTLYGHVMGFWNFSSTPKDASDIHLHMENL